MVYILDAHELLGGKGLVEMGTFLAILLGTAAGGILIGVDDIGRLLGGALRKDNHKLFSAKTSETIPFAQSLH